MIKNENNKLRKFHVNNLAMLVHFRDRSLSSLPSIHTSFFTLCHEMLCHSIYLVQYLFIFSDITSSATQLDYPTYFISQHRFPLDIAYPIEIIRRTYTHIIFNFFFTSSFFILQLAEFLVAALCPIEK